MNPIRSFASDNNAGIHPRILRAIAAANEGHVVGYGDDRFTEAAVSKFRKHFGDDIEVFIAFNGTAANCLGLKALTESYHAVICAEGAHIYTDECGAPEAFTGCKLIPVPVDSEGIAVPVGVSRCRKARAAYVTPSHQYPLGVTMSAARRFHLLDWAHSHGAWILEDDYDSENRYEAMPIASLQGLDRGSRVIYTGTFSKTLFPSLRLGYMVLPPDLVDRFAAARRAVDLCPPDLYQAVLTDFVDQGHFARHIRKTRLVYKERRSALIDALRQEFGSALEILGAEAGMHLVVTFKEDLSDCEIAARAAQERLWLWPLSTSYIGKDVRQGFILGFGSTKAAEMPQAVRRLRSALSS
jgi:GntR family transcriptional regulator / MocR family aminotransferase